MKITRAQAAIAFSHPPGTPVVALSATGEPVAIGLRVSADPDKRLEEFRTLSRQLVDHADKAGDIANALSSAADLAANLHPGWATQAAVGGDALALFATGLGAVHAARAGDKTKMVIKTLECGASALSLAADSGLFAGSATLRTVALIAKTGGTVATAVYTPPPKPDL